MGWHGQGGAVPFFDLRNFVRTVFHDGLRSLCRFGDFLVHGGAIDRVGPATRLVAMQLAQAANAWRHLRRASAHVNHALVDDFFKLLAGESIGRFHGAIFVQHKALNLVPPLFGAQCRGTHRARRCKFVRVSGPQDLRHN
jgi:hypothetical protein